MGDESRQDLSEAADLGEVTSCGVSRDNVHGTCNGHGRGIAPQRGSLRLFQIAKLGSAWFML